MDKFDDLRNDRPKSVINIKSNLESNLGPSLDSTRGEPDFDIWLSQQLRVSEPHVDNDGFCERVMSSLPAPARRSERRAARFQYTAVLAASAIVVWQFPFDQVLTQAAQQSISLYSLVGIGILSSLVAMTGGILAVRR